MTTALSYKTESGLDEEFEFTKQYTTPTVMKETSETLMNVYGTVFCCSPTEVKKRITFPTAAAIWPATSECFLVLQSWEGHVEKVQWDKEMFSAIIADRTNPDNPNEWVELSINEIGPKDRELIEPGAVFYWSMGYEDRPGYPRQRLSRIYFRRLPGWTEEEVNAAEEEAERNAPLFSGD